MSSHHGLNLLHAQCGYDSELSECGSEVDPSERQDPRRLKKDDPLFKKPFAKNRNCKLVPKSFAAQENDREEAKHQRTQLLAMDAFSRHKKFVNDYLLYYGGKWEDFKRVSDRDKTDMDVVRENHRFLWEEEDERDMTWEKRLAKKYYDKMFKEYCIADLSRYKENKVGMRWRIENEVISGKGQFECGNKRCQESEGLRSWEVNFGYVEAGEKKNALVKLRLCPECSNKLNYHHKKREVKRKRKEEKEEERRMRKEKRRRSHHGEGTLSDTVDDEEGSSSGESRQQGDAVAEASGASQEPKKPKEMSESDYWKGPVQETEEKCREDEFEDYFEDMFL